MNEYRRISIQFALKREFRGFTETFAEHLKIKREKPFLCYEFLYKTAKIVFAISGLGKVRTACCCQYLIDHFQPHLAINVGSAGAVAPSVTAKEFFFVKKTIEYDFKSLREKTPCLEIDPELLELAKKINLPFGILGSADQNVDSEEKKEMLSQLGVTIADWEGAAFLRCCKLNDTKAAIFKIITDVSSHNFAEEFAQNVYDYNKILSTYVFNYIDEFLKHPY